MSGKARIAISSVAITTLFIVVGFIFGGGDGLRAAGRAPLVGAAPARLGPVRSTTTTLVRPTATTVRPTATTVRPTTTTTTVRPYSVRTGIVAVSPSIVRAGRTVEVTVDEFPARTTVSVQVKQGSTVYVALTLTTNTRGEVTGTFSAPARGSYTVIATCGQPKATRATTSLMVL